MRRLVFALVLIALAVGLGILLRFNHGNIAILWPPYRLDISVNLAMVLLLAAFVIGHFTIRAIVTTSNLPTVVREYRIRRTREQAIRALGESVVAFYEGRFGRAERLAELARQAPELDAAACLVAARAAHRMREAERRDTWLDALSDEGRHQLAHQVTRAEFLLDDRKSDEALEALELARQAGGRHVHQMRLSLRAHEQDENWPALLRVLTQLEKRHALPEEVIQGLRARAWRGRLRAAQHSPDQLRLLLKEGARELERPELADATVDALMNSEGDKLAAQLIERVLADQYRPGLVLRYAELREPAARDRLRVAEGWLQAQGEEPALLECLGRLCLAEGLWGKAEDFLQRAQKRNAGPGALLALAQVYEKVGRSFDAAQLYKRIATGQ